MALLQIYTTPLGQGLLTLATLMFNQQVCSIMPVLDWKPIGKDYDDEHHSRLLERQHKNDNDASTIFESIPVGSAVAVQQEDGGPWTHGTVVSIGNHNHHDCTYIIQLTRNGRWITCYRQHIKPTSVTVETYLQYQTTKHSNTQTDLLEVILKCIKNNQMAYASMQTNNSDIHDTKCHQQTKKSQPGRGEDNRPQGSEVINKNHRQKSLNTPEDNGIVQQNSEVIKTRYGQTVKKPDRL